MTSSNIDSLPIRVLKDGDKVVFDATDSTAPTPGSSLGTAEFAFCPQWNRGKLKAMHVFPMQQRHVTETWVIECKGARDITIDSWKHKGIDAVRPWIWFWCKEHRCMSMRVYVPRNSCLFTVEIGSGLGIYFDGRDV